jgi:uncharacterized protein (TIGR04255 family)
MKQKLTKPPLIEAILEIRWKLNEVQQGLFVDPKYKILVGRLYDRMAKEYPVIEPLPTASMPDEMVPYTVQHRFREKTGKWPLVQVGPGVVTLNDTEKYSWNRDFELRAHRLISTLFETYPDAEESLKISAVQIRYINAIDFNFQNESILPFISDKLKIKLGFPAELFRDAPINPIPSGFNAAFSFPVTKPTGTLLLGFTNGKHNKNDALIWDIVLNSTESELPTLPSNFKEWLNSAHAVVENMFFTLIEGSLEDSFK